MDEYRNKSVAEELREFNKWRRGKGKKYQSPGVPFDTKRIGEDIDYAVKALPLLISEKSLDALCSIGKCTLHYMKSVAKDFSPVTLRREDAESKIRRIAEAVNEGVKILRKYRRINKRQETPTDSK